MRLHRPGKKSQKVLVMGYMTVWQQTIRCGSLWTHPWRGLVVVT